MTEPEGIVVGDDGVRRCWWGASTPDYCGYHDDEWGLPTGDDRTLFEKVCLEGFQSGLSWLTILRKRDNFRAAFDGFDHRKVARYDDGDVERLLGDAGIVRHRKKILSTINNAQRAGELIAEFGSLAAYFWRFEPRPEDRPSEMTKAALMSLNKTPASTALAKDLKRRGWSFVGPTTAYAFMQAMGLVNDHLEGCDARPRIATARTGFTRP